MGLTLIAGATDHLAHARACESTEAKPSHPVTQRMRLRIMNTPGTFLEASTYLLSGLRNTRLTLIGTAPCTIVCPPQLLAPLNRLDHFPATSHDTPQLTAQAC